MEGIHDVQAEADVEFAMTVGKDVEMFTKLGIIVDFDGTLSYLAKTPGKPNCCQCILYCEYILNILNLYELF